MSKGLFITFEGTEGSGKSTQVAALVSRLTALSHRVRQLREPGGTPIGEEIRHTLEAQPGEHRHDRRGRTPLLMNASRLHRFVREVIHAPPYARR